MTMGKTDKYEYRIEKGHSANLDEKQLNEYGDKGWEAVGVSTCVLEYSNIISIVLFKRKIVPKTGISERLRKWRYKTKKVIKKVYLRTLPMNKIIEREEFLRCVSWELRDNYLEYRNFFSTDVYGQFCEYPDYVLTEYIRIKAGNQSLLNDQQKQLVVRIMNRAVKRLKSFNENQ